MLRFILAPQLSDITVLYGIFYGVGNRPFHFHKNFPSLSTAHRVFIIIIMQHFVNVPLGGDIKLFI